MKKLLNILLFVLFFCSLVACTKKSNTTKKPTTTEYKLKIYFYWNEDGFVRTHHLIDNYYFYLDDEKVVNWTIQYKSLTIQGKDLYINNNESSHLAYYQKPINADKIKLYCTFKDYGYIMDLVQGWNKEG